MTDAFPPALLERLCRLAGTLPEGLSRLLAAQMRTVTTSAERDRMVARMLPQLLPDNRGLFTEIVEEWAQHQHLTGAEISAALEAVAFQERRHRESSSVELVWTGPSVVGAGLRNTEQVMLDMIRTAQKSIYVITFAAYKVDSLVTALKNAISRGVRVTFVLEDKEESAGKVSLSPSAVLTGAGLEAAAVYVWPLDQRERNERGSHGSLHAKCVLSDSRKLFVSSANMTEFALTLNIELGVLLNGGDAPAKVERNVAELIRTGILRGVSQH